MHAVTNSIQLLNDMMNPCSLACLFAPTLMIALFNAWFLLVCCRYVHEMVTFRRVRGLHLYGHPETQHSWFPGYAWTIAHCSNCGQHLGWRFTATRPVLAPKMFWGLRRPVLMCSSASADGNRWRTEQQDDVDGLHHDGPEVEGLGLLPGPEPQERLVIQLGELPGQ